MSTGAAAPAAMTIHEATRVPGGVQRGAAITFAQAVARRQAGLDIVICGDNTIATCNQAWDIELAVGPCRHHPAHASGGLHALPHWQQLTPPPDGHSFYETNVTKALP